jgi:hypothetical protein
MIVEARVTFLLSLSEVIALRPEIKLSRRVLVRSGLYRIFHSFLSPPVFAYPLQAHIDTLGERDR